MSEKIETLLEINGKVYGGEEIDLILLGRGIEKERIIKLLFGTGLVYESINSKGIYYAGFNGDSDVSDIIALIRGEIE